MNNKWRAYDEVEFERIMPATYSIRVPNEDGETFDTWSCTGYTLTMVRDFLAAVEKNPEILKAYEGHE